MNSNKNTEALITNQRLTSIYKELNGQDVQDKTLANYITRSSIINFFLQKFDDSLRNLNEAEKILKKLAPTDPEAKEALASIQVNKKTFEEKRKEFENLKPKQLKAKSKLIPDTPLKIALLATVVAGIVGTAAFLILKKRNV